VIFYFVCNGKRLGQRLSQRPRPCRPAASSLFLTLSLALLRCVFFFSFFPRLAPTWPCCYVFAARILPFVIATGAFCFFFLAPVVWWLCRGGARLSVFRGFGTGLATEACVPHPAGSGRGTAAAGPSNTTVEVLHHGPARFPFFSHHRLSLSRLPTGGTSQTQSTRTRGLFSPCQMRVVLGLPPPSKPPQRPSGQAREEVVLLHTSCLTKSKQ